MLSGRGVGLKGKLIGVGVNVGVAVGVAVGNEVGVGVDVERTGAVGGTLTPPIVARGV